MTNLYPKHLAAFRWICLLVFPICLAIPESKAQPTNQPGRSPLKMAPTDALKKIGPELAILKKQQVARQSTATLPAITRHANTSLLQTRGNYVVIEALAENSPAQLLADLQALGMTRPASFGRLVSGLVPIAALDKVAALASLHSARPAYKPFTKIGKTTSQGNKALYTDEARKQQIITGKGSKVGIISDSYNSLGGADAGVRSGDLPGKENPNNFTTPVQVLLDEAADTAPDEGRAMAEIVHDLAPGAELAFYSGNFGEASFAQGILDLQKAGCNIITDDLIYFAEPMFQDGVIAQAIDSVKKAGASYFTAAGNNGSNAYQAAFKSGGVAFFGSKSEFGPVKVKNAHNFAPAGKKKDVTQKIYVPIGATIYITFQYNEPFYSVGDGTSAGAKSDLDIYLLSEDTTNVVAGSARANVGDDPVEVFRFTNDGSYESNYFNLLIDKFEGPGSGPSIIKYIVFKSGSDEISIEEYYNAGSTIFGHSNAAGAITTGAVFFLDSPAYGTSTPVAESFSSVGGTPILFDVNGKPRSRLVRRKPEIMGPDGVNNTFFGDSFLDEFYFFGTSAAAPHAAGVAALMQEANGNALKADQIKTALQQTALNMNEPGFDYETGYGFINAQKAIARVAMPRVLELLLVDADSRKTIQVLQTGDILNLTRLPSRNVYIQARTGPTQVGSVLFNFDETEVTENKTPYLFPGATADFFKLTEGSYTLTAVPYTQANGKGSKGVPLTISFRAVEEKVVRFELYNVSDGAMIQKLAEDDVLDLATLPAQLNIRAVTNPVVVGSVQFNLNGQTTVENINTYDLAGSSGQSIAFKPGDYALTAAIYPYEMARGAAGGTLTVHFRVIDRSLKTQDGQLAVYPNPFSQQAKLRFSVPATQNATLTIYNLNGAEVAVLHRGEARAGQQYEYTWNGGSLPGGWYISRLVTGKTALHQKIRLLK
ncbi:S8 family serine peptidase [Adhaeribacter pallidiroseus]|uniref:Peptidase S8/S53 domain-containing protein n=1 Tax=Adhaeribacter pallidiroseus TaxID=2072847 RepID=A0A369QH27_9BACT|nr:S8 family serine peptidase [Adhaeribacter pallidiroseus]RDC64233.1 hypothetical protein AHMF7616_02845 [Adhaeribacter pallidiroseus]